MNEGVEDRSLPVLKLKEPEVDPQDPWRDDIVGRKELSDRLTRLVSPQVGPLVISLHGGWGTGKTFFLKRWQASMERHEFSAIYLNAWEDDFCDDPLLALLGQLSEYFKGSTFHELVGKATASALPLIKANIQSLILKHTGLTLEIEESKRDFLGDYLKQRDTKDELKGNLTELAETISNETNHSLIFIIDELDRCRPTYAIELLERIKHIFDIPNVVFVLGLNRDELTKSLISLYGNIDADVYLRRFFDLEFRLRETSPEVFTSHLLNEFRLETAFQDLTSKYRQDVHVFDYENYARVVPKLWNAIGMSLRDIDHGVRLLALTASTVPGGGYTVPHLLSVLLVLKFKNPSLFLSLSSGEVNALEVIEYIDNELATRALDNELSEFLYRSEGFLYCCDEDYATSAGKGEKAYQELTDPAMVVPHATLSERAQRADQYGKHTIAIAIRDGQSLGLSSQVFERIVCFIDLCQGGFGLMGTTVR